jgi:hypothetical protein
VPLTVLSFTASSVQPLHEISAYGTPEATRNAIWRSILFDRVPESETGPAPDYAAGVIVHAALVLKPAKEARSRLSFRSRCEILELLVHHSMNGSAVKQILLQRRRELGGAEGSLGA